ncbi:hypothetical protein CFE70_000214 [Pyrenophora teres f. teres 0-1]|uniref:Uncharacterized protein n=2 Tax=Pyrenophora teres f. teres TaxID=97479 RepID=E3RMG0_PYRTT|nr:hypothetical protein PTT_09632 [Pyrenophora teres f. teres 0-1]KAE8836530.1 hypothetical protein HRS9139_04628 [Pyrenophora teres f. teres]KAE8837500.1 hypothetical protein PTNB85_04835 [Pyrenophora teres f. teres]KAE8840080.1 hypothetical protein HRS9122_06685 [Pyrenophora teres f. teres]KAE8862326.1 hypothetical protein PTNB29_04888 [Pyrenophora teres f. teres]
MLGQILTVTALVALTQAKAIVTNNCPFNVYVWSVPNVPHGSMAENVPIKSGGHYQEPWRLGSLSNPGVSIKISSRANGINEGADEINFAYAIDPKDDSKIWVDLSKVRGEPPKVLFYTCRGEISSTNAGTVQCTAKDEIELVLCGPTRSTRATDTASLEQIKACYDGKHAARDDDTDGEDSEWYQARKQAEPSGASQLTDSYRNDFADADYPRALENSEAPQCQAKVIHKRSQRATITSEAFYNRTLVLCDLLQKFHPEATVNCDEEVMKHRAKRIYPRICDPAVEPLLMGFPCEEVMRELETKYIDMGIDAAQEPASMVAVTGSVTMVENNTSSSSAMSGSSTEVRATKDSDKECFMDLCVNDYRIDSSVCATLEHLYRKILADFDLPWYNVFDASCPSPARGTDATKFSYIEALCTDLNKDSKVCVTLDKLIHDFALDYFHKAVCFTSDNEKCES